MIPKWKYLRNYFQREFTKFSRSVSWAEVGDTSKIFTDILQHYALHKSCINIGKVEASLQESFELLEAQEDCNDAEKKTESPLGIMLKHCLPR
jgi:hypothetical protein